MLGDVFCDELERSRDTLHLLARIGLGGALRSRVDPSDIVQRTMLQAVQARESYRGDTPAQFAAWLRAILARNLAHAARDEGRDRRDVARERSLQVLLDDSSARLERFLADPGDSPSELARRDERLAEMVAALERLPEAQRSAVTMHYIEGASLVETAAHLGKSLPSVAGLLHRALKALRSSIPHPE